MATYKPPRHLRGGIHARTLTARQQHRRSGAKKTLTRRINAKLFRGRTVNAPRHRW